MKAWWQPLVVTIVLIAGISGAAAGLARWSVETEKDPFSGGVEVTASYSSSFRSGVFLTCNTVKAGIELKAVAGWELNAESMLALSAMTPKAAVAVDGQVLLNDMDANTAACGQNIACITVNLDRDQSNSLLEAMIAARRQIAVKDGISDKPHLLRARGSTRSGKALLKCLNKQGSAQSATKN
jgi:hypothetical protein